MDQNGGRIEKYFSKPSSPILAWNTGPFKRRKYMICSTGFSRPQRDSQPISAGKCKCSLIQNTQLTAMIRYAGSIILSVVYGYDIVSSDDPLVELVESTEQAFTVGPLPKWLVNGFPFLRHIPSWMPGAGFKRYAISIREKWHQQVDVPYNYTMTASEVCGLSLMYRVFFEKLPILVARRFTYTSCFEPVEWLYF